MALPIRKPIKAVSNTAKTTTVENDSVISLPSLNLETEKPAVDEHYVIDEKTGLKHRVFDKADPDLIKSFKANNAISLETLRKYVKQDEKFSDVSAFLGSGLDSIADDFLIHLRQPPSKEEIEKNRKLLKQMYEQQNGEYNKTFENVDESQTTFF